MTGFSFTLALLMGFTGSLHCAGMCGPIVWVMPFQFLSGIKKFLGIALYHLGRITTYALLALVLHSFRSLFTPHIQQYVSIALGVLLLFAGILAFIPSAVGTGRPMPWAGYIKQQLGYFISRAGLPSLFMAGFLNGLLPCGLVYMALSASVTATTAVQSMELMYVFGLGTAPMLVSITLLKSKMTFVRATHFRKLVPVAMFVLGGLFVVRGMNLGIPYLSPSLAVTEQGVKASCCHHKK
ncbi:MAG: sulfite exporter TauE/SafE family protein [Bacteroidetes bacterium]|nr:sulfite exporter TauE/SafE family protein [Bacteroidota bacterium]